MGIKIVRTEKKPIQYTKLLLNLVLILVTITTLASVYINLVNGLGLDGVVMSCWDGLKFIIPSYCCKSYFETKEEKKGDK